MDLQTWLKGCLSSGLEQGSKLAMIILSAFTVGSHLDIKTLAFSVSVGFLFGVTRWVYFNPLAKTTDKPQPRIFKGLK